MPTISAAILMGYTGMSALSIGEIGVFLSFINFIVVVIKYANKTLNPMACQ